MVLFYAARTSTAAAALAAAVVVRHPGEYFARSPPAYYLLAAIAPASACTWTKASASRDIDNYFAKNADGELQMFGIGLELPGLLRWSRPLSCRHSSLHHQPPNMISGVDFSHLSALEGRGLVRDSVGFAVGHLRFAI